ncbi:MAG: hypothetical protein DBX59_00710 [Bacillota bacterium]|nr:MAG: hypothetical protein DBX59_00710 [Bacillota bacterium]
MDGKRDIIEEIIHLPEGEVVDEHLIDDILSQPEQPAKRKSDTIVLSRMASGIVSALIALLLAAVFFCIYWITAGKMPPVTPNDENRYFDSTEISYESIEDMPTFIQTNGLNVHYFTNEMGMGQNTAGYLLESGELVFLKQKLVFIDFSLGILDEVQLGVVLSNDTFQDFDYFNKISDETKIDGIDVIFGQEIVKDQVNIKAKFEHEEISYFLEITTDNAEGKLEFYINTLLEL